MPTFLLSSIAIALTAFIFYRIWRNPYRKPTTPLPESSKKLLEEHIDFYQSLSPVMQKRFEWKVQEFLINTTITGIKTVVTELDKILIASGAIIPIIAFPKWQYRNLKEVLLYPNSFSHTFNNHDPATVLGMVGYGIHEGKMYLSKESLRSGFKNGNDKKNVAIHEFVHLIDKMDGVIDGVPAVLMGKTLSVPWIKQIKENIDLVAKGKTDINPYGGTNSAEFLAVTVEYLFERPKLLKRKHPKIYKVLNEAFKLDESS